MKNENVMLIFSIFGSLFFTALYMLFVDMLVNGIKAKNVKKIIFAILLIIVPVAYGLLTNYFVVSKHMIPPRWLIYTLFKLIPNILAVEGGLMWPFMGVLFYVLRRRQILQVIPIVLFSVLFFFWGIIQWMVIFAVIPVLLYNGTRGSGHKYFFYIFYPAHIYLFYIVAYILK